MPTKKATASRPAAAITAPVSLNGAPAQHAAPMQQSTNGRIAPGGAGAAVLPPGMLNSLFMHLPSGVIVVDLSGQTIFMNEAGTRLRSEMALTDSSVAEIQGEALANEPMPVTHGMLVAQALAGKEVRNADYVFGMHGEARHRVVEIAITPLRDDMANITGALLTLTDLTERVEGQAMLARVADAAARNARETLAREATTLARKAITQAQDNRELTRSNLELEQQATRARAADASAQDAREALAREAGMLAREAVAQALSNSELTRSNLALEQQASLSRVADASAQDIRETLAHEASILAERAIAQALNNSELTRSNLQLERQATLARAADASAEGARETLAREATTLARKAITQAQDNRDLTRSNIELEQRATLSRAADASAEDTREILAHEAIILAKKAVAQAQDNRELTRSNLELVQQAMLGRVSDALARVTREALAREAGTLAEKAIAQALNNSELTRSNLELAQQVTQARVADASAEDAREILAQEARVLAKKAVAQAQDNSDLTRSNLELVQQAMMSQVADALAQVTRETLAQEAEVLAKKAIAQAKEAEVLAKKAVVQAQDNRELTRSNSELQLFASVASHDLQEPLRKIQAFGDRLKKSDGETLTDQGKDYLERMQGAASRMQELINDLLSYARVTMSTAPFVPVDLAGVAREVLSDLETQIERSGGKVDVGTLPVIDADPLQMRQLLQNLLSNALKFSRPDQPPVVKLSAEIVPAMAPDQTGSDDPPLGERCRLTVSDNGIGFEAKHAERIFGIFERLHGRTVYEGTGIGLSLCRQIVERHGGSLIATSAPGQGATFVMSLPTSHPQRSIVK